MQEQLRKRYCSTFGCPPESFEEAALRQCLYPHARMLTFALRLVKPHFFAWDLELLEVAGETRNLNQLLSDVRAFPHRKRTRGLLRGWLRVRLSTSRLVGLATECFAQSDGSL